jgi:hypothetical protein
MFTRRVATLGLFSLLSACGSDDATKPGGEAAEERDAEMASDAATEPDAERERDAGASPKPDAGSKSDAATGGRPAEPMDGGSRLDATAGSPQACASIELTYTAFDKFFGETCRGCHSQSRSAAERSGAPPDVNFDSKADLIRLRDRIRKAAVEERRMPPNAALDDCRAEQLSDYLDTLPAPSCEPACVDKTCGDDGCGGTCGNCSSGQHCEDHSCVVDACTPDCSGKQCGANGCGGTCGTCDAGMTCSAAGTCMCEPNCQGKQCGANGCGGTCGTCDSGMTCSAAGTCMCEPDCQGKQCGSDGCGGTCGACGAGLVCDTNAGACQASCSADCTGKTCGDDGCGGSCGTCTGGLTCNTAAQCACTPQCTGKSCGDDGCGGSCGTCTAGQSCDAAGSCVAAAIDFTNDVYPIFAAAGCGDANCHGGGAPAQGLNLSSAASALAGLVGVAANECDNRLRVAAGAPAGSYLINKLTGEGLCSGERMPRGRPALSNAQIDTVRAWITGL